MRATTTKATKVGIVNRYMSGEPAEKICKELQIPRSSFYYWTKLYGSQTTRTGIIVTPKELDSAKRRIKKLENIIYVLKAVDCTATSPLKEKLGALESLYGQYSVHVLCEALEVSRGAFYNHILRNKRENAWFVKRRQDLMSEIQEVFDDSNQIFGAGKIRAVLMNRGCSVSEKIVSELMREMGLYSVRIASKKENRRLSVYEKRANVLKQDFKTEEPDKVWVSDITYYKYKDTHFHICVFIDLFSRKIISLTVGKNSSTHLVKRAFEAACRSRKATGLIVHTDRGTPYTSYSMENAIKKIGGIHSFSHAGRPHDNAVVESFFATLKKEELYRVRYKSEIEFRKSLDNYVSFFNSVRPHRYLNYKTPDQAESTFWNNSKITR